MFLGAQSYYSYWNTTAPARGALVEGLQTLSYGSKSQVIGAKEQGPKRACGCALAYIRSMARVFIYLLNS